jgi:hypothetical protein
MPVARRKDDGTVHVLMGQRRTMLECQRASGTLTYR